MTQRGMYITVTRRYLYQNANTNRTNFFKFVLFSTLSHITVNVFMYVLTVSFTIQANYLV